MFVSLFEEIIWIYAEVIYYFLFEIFFVNFL